MMTTNFEFNTDGSFQCILSISGPISSIPAPHQRALSLTVPLCEALYWSFLWIGRAWRPVTVTYHPRLLPRPPCTHWHSYIPPAPGSPNPKLGHRETIYYYNCPPSTYSRSLSQFVLCRGGAEGGLVGGWWQISGPDSQPGLKIA